MRVATGALTVALIGPTVTPAVTAAVAAESSSLAFAAPIGNGNAQPDANVVETTSAGGDGGTGIRSRAHSAAAIRREKEQVGGLSEDRGNEDEPSAPSVPVLPPVAERVVLRDWSLGGEDEGEQGGGRKKREPEAAAAAVPAATTRPHSLGSRRA